MRCVKCAGEIKETRCPRCGFEHKNSSVSFLTEPSEEDICVPFPDFEIVGNRLERYTGGSARVTVPGHVRIVGCNAFRANKTVREILLPEGLTEAEDGAFQDCTALQEVAFPKSMLRYGDNLFAGCGSLKQVRIAGNRNTIYENAFRSSLLERIEFLPGITVLDKNALSWCYSLKTIVVPNSVRRVQGSDAHPQSSSVSVFAPAIWLLRYNRNGAAFRADQGYNVVQTAQIQRMNHRIQRMRAILPVLLKLIPALALVCAIAVFGIKILTAPPANKWVAKEGKTYYNDAHGEPVKGLVDISGMYYGFDKTTGELLTGRVPAERLADLPANLSEVEITVILDEKGRYEAEEWVWTNLDGPWAKGGETQSTQFADYKELEYLQTSNVVYFACEVTGLDQVPEDAELTVWFDSGDDDYGWWSSSRDSTAVRYDEQAGTATAEWKFNNPEEIIAYRCCFAIPTEEENLFTAVPVSSMKITKLIQRFERSWDDPSHILTRDGSTVHYDKNGQPSGGLLEVKKADSNYSRLYGYDKTTGELLVGAVPAERLVDLSGNMLLADEITVMLDRNGEYQYEEWVFSDLDGNWEVGGRRRDAAWDYKELDFDYVNGVTFFSCEATGTELPKDGKDGQWALEYCKDYNREYSADGNDSWFWGGAYYDEQTETVIGQVDFREPGSITAYSLNYVSQPSWADTHKILKTDLTTMKVTKLVQRRNEYDGILDEYNGILDKSSQ